MVVSKTTRVDPLGPRQGSTDTNRPVLYHLLGHAELRQRYLAHMRTVPEEPFHPTCLTPLINQFSAPTVAAIAADPKKSYTMTAYTNDGMFGAATTNYPAGTKIAPDGYLLIWADEDGKASPGLHASFKLEKSGEQIFFTDTDASNNAVLDSVTYPDQESDRSYGRSPDGADVWVVMDPTPGQPKR